MAPPLQTDVAPAVQEPAEPAVAFAAPEEQTPAESDALDPSLPKVPLSSDLLYRLLKAELDFKNGNWQGPYMSLIGAAQQTRDPRLARRAAEMALAGKHADESMAAVRLWRELAPDSEEATQYYLGFAIMSDNLAEAEQIFKRRLQDASPAARGLAMFQIQQFLARAKDKVAAGAMLERLLQPYQDTMEAHVVQAQLAAAREDGALAMKEAQAALRLKPDSEIAVLTLAQVSPDPDSANALLAGFLAAHPTASEVRAARARLLVSQKQYGPARAEFLALLKDKPDNLGTLYALGIMSMQLGESPAAEKYFARFIDVLAANPSDERDPSKVLMILAQLAEERGDTPAALQWLDKIEDGDGRAGFTAQLKRAQLIGKSGDIEGARRLLAGLKTDEPPEQAQIVVAQSQILRDAGKLEDAYAVLEAGAKRFPANPDLLYDFALLAEKTGRVDVMESTLREVIVQAPDNHHAYNALGYSLAERNVRLPEALELIGKALSMAPDDPFIMDSMGWVQYRLGKLEEAAQILRRAYALRSDAEIGVHLGEVLWHQGQKAAAQQLWREARAKDPKNDTLKNTLARLQPNL